VVVQFFIPMRAFENNLLEYISLLAIFGVAHLFFSYLMSFFFNNKQNALKAFSFMYLIVGYALPYLCK